MISEEMRGKLLHLFMDINGLEDRAKILRFESKEGVLKGGYISSENDERLHAVFNLPTFSDSVFITVTDGDPEEVGELMSYLEGLDCSSSPVGVGHVVRFENEYFSNNGVVGVFISNVGVSPVFRELPNPIVFKEERVWPYLVIFLSDNDYETWKSLGASGLMESFRESRKCLVSIKQK